MKDASGAFVKNTLIASAVSEHEAEGHLKNHLFHGLQKHLCESLHYLYDNPALTYNQLMVAAHKAGAKHKVDKHRNSYCSVLMKSGTVTDDNGNGEVDTDSLLA